MPVTTRLQARLSALKALETASRGTRSPAPSPIPPSSPPQRPRTVVNPLVNIHGRRSLTHTLHHFQGDITSTPFAVFPQVWPIYVPEPEEVQCGGDLSDLPDYVSESEYGYLTHQEAALDDADDDLPDYVSDTEPEYEYRSPPGASPAVPSGSFNPYPYARAVHAGAELRGTKRKRSDEGLLTGVEKFLDHLPVGTMPTIREMIDPVLPSPSFIAGSVISKAASPPTKKPKLEQIEEIPMHPRAKTILKRLQNTDIVMQAPSLSPIIELPEKKTRYYMQESNEDPDDPNWVPEWHVHPTWPGSLSPKISPTAGGTTLFSVAINGKKRKFNEIREKMKISNVLNPAPALTTLRLPSFNAVVTGVEWLRLHDEDRIKAERGAVVGFEKPQLLKGWERGRL